MITGYNTDVKYGDLVLHVQTEDKGEGNPCVESLIYCGGQVVIAKRANYSELLESGKGRDEVTVLMERQHRGMMKAIHAGRFDDKIREFFPAAVAGKEATKSMSVSTDALDLVEEGNRTLDQVILEYLTSEAEQEQLLLMMDGEVDIKAGMTVDVGFRASSSKSGTPVVNANVAVKMISTFGGPQTLATGRTGSDGSVQLRLDIPQVEGGTAALIMTAASEIGQAELKQLL